MVGLEVRVEGQAEQAALAPVFDLPGDVHEESRLQDPVLDHPDGAALLDDEQPVRAVAGAGDLGRRQEAVGDVVERDPASSERRQRRSRGPRERRKAKEKGDD